MTLGGQGRYAAAAAVLEALLVAPEVPRAIAAHAAVTLASHRRQLGGHALARRHDALGLRLAAAAGTGTSADATGTGPWAARVDALVGLAADALGTGDPGVTQRLLDRAEAEAAGHPSWRPAVRAGWVRAELALVRGAAAEAVDPADRALTSSRRAGSVRHVLKSRIVLAVARSAVDADPAVVARAVADLDAAAAEAGRHGLLPLVWPARLAAADLLARFPDLTPPEELRSPSGHATSPADDPFGGATRRRHAARDTISVIERRSDPVGRRLLGESLGVLLRHQVV